MSANVDCSGMQVVVLMGGLGTRLGRMTEHVTKAMLPIGEKPFFSYELHLLRNAGFRRFLFLVGYRAEDVREYFGDGSCWGICIDYQEDGDKLRGTGGAVLGAWEKLEDEFLLLYGDSFMDVDYEEIVYRFRRDKKRKPALMTVLHNDGRFDESNAMLREGNLYYDKQHIDADMDYIDYGISCFSKDVFQSYLSQESLDLAIVQHDLSMGGQLNHCEVVNRFYEIGRPESLEEFSKYAKRRFLEQRSAVFLDRDGVINEIVFNEETEQLDSPFCAEQFHMLPGVAEAVKRFHALGYWVFVVTNQPAAAKGKTSLAHLYDVNLHMGRLLTSADTYLDGIRMCAHYPRETVCLRETFLIKECDCRKPQPGMISRLAAIFHLDLARSYVIGDSISDMQLAKVVGAQGIFIGKLKCDACQRLAAEEPICVVGSLPEAAEYIESRG